MHSHYTERGTRPFLYTERSFWNQKAHYFFLQGPVTGPYREARNPIRISPCILMTVVRMLFFVVLNLTIFVKRGASVSRFVSAGWWFVCFLTTFLCVVEERW
jgi:hypothetical protein